MKPWIASRSLSAGRRSRTRWLAMTGWAPALVRFNCQTAWRFQKFGHGFAIPRLLRARVLPETSRPPMRGRAERRVRGAPWPPVQKWKAQELETTVHRTRPAFRTRWISRSRAWRPRRTLRVSAVCRAHAYRRHDHLPCGQIDRRGRPDPIWCGATAPGRSTPSTAWRRRGRHPVRFSRSGVRTPPASHRIPPRVRDGSRSAPL